MKKLLLAAIAAAAIWAAPARAAAAEDARNHGSGSIPSTPSYVSPVAARPLARFKTTELVSLATTIAVHGRECGKVQPASVKLAFELIKAELSKRPAYDGAWAAAEAEVIAVEQMFHRTGAYGWCRAADVVIESMDAGL
jgi:hypothetical protein